MNTALVMTGVGVATMGAGAAVAVAAPTDWTGVAAVIGAVGVLFVSLGNVVTGIMQARQKRDTEEMKETQKRSVEDQTALIKEVVREILETKAVAIKTGEAVNGGVTKILAAKDKETDAKVELATAEGALGEKEAQAARQGIADAATLKERERAAVPVAPVTAAPTDPAAALGKPVPVEVVNAGNTVLEVIDKTKGTS